MDIKVSFDFYKYAMVTVEAKLDGLAMNRHKVNLLYYATINSVHSEAFIPTKPLEFEELRIMQGWPTIEQCLDDAAKILRERVK